VEANVMNIRKWFDVKQIILLISLILIGTIGRYILVEYNVQPFPNFEIIMVLTFLAVVFLRSTIAFLVPLFSMICSDLLLGNPVFVGSRMNQIVLFTYSGFAIIALINILKKERFRTALGEFRLKNIGMAAGLGVGFVLIYDVWTNIGWWYLIYPHTSTTLVAVFTAGIPFMIYHLISGVVTFVAIALPVVAWASHKHYIELPHITKGIHKLPVAAVALVLIALSFSGTALQVPEKTEVWLEHSDETSVTIVIQGDEWTIKENIFAYKDDTVFSVLERCTERNMVSLEYTYYEEFNSMLIDAINKNVNGDGDRYWQYYVNGELPMIGCDQYMVSNGDYVLWTFESIPY
jgi:hypothetical protein